MKKLCAAAGAVILVLVLALTLIFLQGQTYRYSPHRWHEGSRDKVIYDVMENYVFPGMQLQSVLDSLGEGQEVDAEWEARILQYCGYSEKDAYGVLVYNIEKSHGVYQYFAVVHDGSSVVQTMLGAMSDE